MTMLEEVRDGLSRPQKELSPKWFYDERGSELFEEITRLEEYYPTRTERRLLAEHMPDWVRALRPATLVELGAGAADKTTSILDAMHDAVETPVYVPIDISGAFLEKVAAGLRRDYPLADVRPLEADMTAGFHLPEGLPGPALFALLGGTIGNFPDEEGVDLLRSVASEMSPADRFLLGTDLVKDVGTLEAAYNDARGVTAEFNLNALRVVNHELDADFDVDAFRHSAHYDPDQQRIEMHLIATRPTIVNVPGAGAFAFREGESVRTEVSCKYTRESAIRMCARAGLALEAWEAAEPGFALSLWRLRETRSA